MSKLSKFAQEVLGFTLTEYQIKLLETLGDGFAEGKQVVHTDFKGRAAGKTVAMEILGRYIQDGLATTEPAESYICCEELGNALGDHNGLHSQTIGSIHSDKLDEIVMYKGGDYKIRNRIIVQYCPFCGKPRRRASEYKKEA